MNFTNVEITDTINEFNVAVEVPEPPENYFLKAVLWDSLSILNSLESVKVLGTSDFPVKNNGENFIIEADADSGNIYIWGKRENEGTISITVLYPNKTLLDLEHVTPADYLSVVSHCEELNTDEDGNFQLGYRVKSGKSGSFSVLINYNDGKNASFYPNAFDYYTKDDLDKILEYFNKANANYRELILKYAKILNIDTADYLALGDIAEKVDAYLQSNIEYDTAAKLKNTFYSAVAVQLINLGSDILQYETVAMKYGDYIGFTSLDIYKTYDNFDNESKNYVKEQIIKKSNYKLIADIQETFAENVLLRAISMVKSNADVQQIILNNANYFGLDITNYKKLTDKTPVNAALGNKHYSSVSEFKTDFYNAVEQQLNAEKKKTSSSGGGGGGGPMRGGTTSLIISDTDKSEKSVEKSSFRDIDSVAWAADAINYFAEKKVLIGKENGIFAPNDNISRAEFVKMIVLAFGLNNEYDEINYSDIKSSDWYYPYIAAAKKANIVTGIAENYFGASENISREDISVMLYRMLKNKDIQQNSRFMDSDEISPYAATAVGVLQSKGIITGAEENKFLPKNCSTRAEAATMLYKMLISEGII